MKVDANIAGATFVLTTLLIVFVVGTIWGFIKRPRLQSILELGMMLGVMYVGWTVRTWPSRQKGDGMLMSLAMAWRDSVITLLYLTLKLFGIIQFWHWLVKVVT